MVWEAEMLLRLLLAVLFGGLIGLERESLNKSAGLRTHALVSVGSCLIMLVSITLTPHSRAPGISVDSARIAAQVVSGVGFLGAGTIMRSGINVKGLTTAATLWLVAGIGLAVGSGNYLASSFTTFLVYVLLVYFCKIEELTWRKKRIHHLNITLINQPAWIGLVTTAIRDLEIEIKNIDIKDSKTNEMIQIELMLKLPYHLSIDRISFLLGNLKGVQEIKIV